MTKLERLKAAREHVEIARKFLTDRCGKEEASLKRRLFDMSSRLGREERKAFMEDGPG